MLDTDTEDSEHSVQEDSESIEPMLSDMEKRRNKKLEQLAVARKNHWR